VTDKRPPRDPVRRPRVAEIVAATLRNRILSGDLRHNTALPKHDELFAEFGVSMPSIREALRILETEGLITVRRGARGGALVHRPDPTTAGYVVGLLMQASGIDVTDLAAAVRQIEPLCAGMCAARADRAEAVLPELRAVQADSADVFDDFPKFVEQMRRFHETMLRCSGNETMRLLLGILENIWYTQEAAWAPSVNGRADPPEAKARYQSLREHDLLIDAIERGDVEGATQLARNHLHDAQRVALLDDNEQASRPVDARLQRPMLWGSTSVDS
jgi:GntR family transcriptional regulator, transcriptional repressor for pyruvate dehydrogenase complex